MASPSRRLRADLPFRRIALALSGGGGLGAYEVGAFRAFEQAGLEPRIILGVSVGAINALIWVTHGFESESLRRVWRKLRPPSVGIRWLTLGARSIGAFLLALAVLETVLMLADLPELKLGGRIFGAALEWRGMIADGLAWGLVAIAGGLMLLFSRRLEDALVKLTPPSDPERAQRLAAWTLIALAALYPVSYLVPFSWPRRFHLVLVLLGSAIWLLGRSARTGGLLRRILMRALPETGGRGLWRNTARRRLIDGLLPRNSEALGFDGRTHYFVNWSVERGAFRSRISAVLGDAVEMRTRKEVLEAALASSAVPVLFEPVRIRGRHYMDGGVFSNQPIHAVLADEAD